MRAELGILPGEGVPSPVGHLGCSGSSAQLLVTGGCEVKQMASQGMTGVPSGLCQGRPSGPHGPELETLACVSQSSRVEVNNSLMANYCWHLLGNSQPCSFPGLRASMTMGSFTLGHLIHSPWSGFNSDSKTSALEGEDHLDYINGVKPSLTIQRDPLWGEKTMNKWVVGR